MKFTLSLSAITIAALMQAASAPAHAAAPGEPEIQTYSLDMEAKVLTDRRTNGLSDTYRRPGAEFTVTAAHESGFLGYLQLGTVAKESFPDGNKTTALAAMGYRWGKPEGWHFGAGAAHEMFPGSSVELHDNEIAYAMGGPAELVKTNFDTTFGLFEFGYGIIEARYLLVLSKDFRGNNTSVVCGAAAQIGMIENGGADLSQAMSCYDRGYHNSRGSQLLQVEAKIPLNGSTKLVTHIGYTAVRNFSFLNTLDYKLGVSHTRWGFEFEADIVGGSMRNSYYGKTATTDGTSVKRIDEPALMASIAKRF
ncbi:MAG: hypothetical protein HY019_18845 [Aquabacterium sp.]|uniref:TorF family putative porin n=1 Tax=Aquabacterium sp. TaxID=1872578 RepID=UPI0025BCC33A|nr:TorF family putative porin [Aquabacterium sp.]MBI3384065.1 hypothetical protein [Aquabacterium sp.]